MDTVTGETIGTINITVYETPEGDNIFNIKTDNQKLLPFLDAIENTLN